MLHMYNGLIGECDTHDVALRINTMEPGHYRQTFINIRRTLNLLITQM